MEDPLVDKIKRLNDSRRIYQRKIQDLTRQIEAAESLLKEKGIEDYRSEVPCSPKQKSDFELELKRHRAKMVAGIAET